VNDAATKPANTPTSPPDRRRGVDVGIVDARFLRSSPSAAAMPPPDAAAPEVAFLGKSNVGKSSLLNALMARKHLVKTSKTPGQTRLINQFGVTLQLRRAQPSLTLVDLPGYGFAKASKADQQALSTLLSGYLADRSGLSTLVHLFDLRHEPTALDVTTWEKLSATLSCPRIVVGTKADRVGAAKKQQHQKVIARALGIATADVVAFSAETREGRPQLWDRILRAVGTADADAADVGDIVGQPPTNGGPSRA
jgi:GTP-binding protein